MTRKHTILIVDDARHNRIALRDILNDTYIVLDEQFYFNTSKHSSELLDTTEHAFAAFLGKCKENFSRIL